MGSERLSFSTAAWLELQILYQYVIRDELDVLCEEHHFTFTYLRHWFSRLLCFNLGRVLSISSLQQKLKNI